MAMELIAFEYAIEVERGERPVGGTRVRYVTGAERRTFTARYAVDERTGMEVHGRGHSERSFPLDEYERAMAVEMRAVLDRDAMRREGKPLLACTLPNERPHGVDPKLLAAGWRPGESA